MKNPIREFRGALLTFLAACGLSACVTDDLGLGELKQSLSGISLFGDEKPGRYPVSAEDLPIHVEAALTAAVMRLRGHSAVDVRKRLKVASSERVLPEAGFDYAGFAVVDIELLKLEAPDDRPAVRSIAGYLHFEDGNRRRATVGFDMDYHVAGISPVVITRASLAPAFPRGARAVMYVVPGAAMEAGLPKVHSYGDLYRLVRTSATPLRLPATAAPAPGPSDRVIVVLFEDRLPTGDRVQVGVSDLGEGVESYTDATQYVAFNDGWVVAMIPGRFALGAREAFWVKAVHTPAAGAEGRVEPALVGLFSTDPAVSPSS